jgi:hypothetical protein
VVRYLQQTRLEVSLCQGEAGNRLKPVENYNWSSYGSYMGKRRSLKEQETFLNDIGEILEMFSQKRERAVRLFSEFTKERTGEKFLDIDFMESQQENMELEETVQELLLRRGVSLEKVKADKKVMEDVVRELKFTHKISGRRIAKLLGINRNTVQRVKSESNKNRPL